MALTLQRLDAPSRSDGVFEQLRHQILTGAVPAGGRIPNERDLAARLGVNRSSVREAIRRLEGLDLVTVRHGRGTYVRHASESSALQVVEALLREPRAITVDLLRQTLLFRRDIVLRVVELAAQHHRTEHLADARALLDRESAEGATPARALELDVAMNRLLGEASGNLMYQVVTNLFTRLLRQLGPLYYNESRDHRRSLETHRRLLVALEARDADEARRILEVMLDYSEQAILEEAERLEAAGVIGPETPAP
ncbi:MAG: FadR family transcriptional regulator [Deltaproteobacteria bacterium]|nr:FadR family transcriptional regulator [Deltaproteobacteria bacterium]MBW2445413.1 FadR family transcriptional regulator [Deltaproteobacteria bacterium]